MTRKRSLFVAEGPELAFPAPAAPPAPPEPAPLPSAPPAARAPVEGADVLDCPAHLLAEMPLATTLQMRRVGHGEPAAFIVTTSRTAYAAAQVEGTPVFSGKELTRMAVAAALDRAFIPQLEDWLERKTIDPAWVLTVVDAVGGGVSVPPDVARWTIGQVFKQLGATLECVTIEG